MDGRSLLRRWRRGRILLEYGGFRSLIPRWGAIRTRSTQYTEWYDLPGPRNESLPPGGSVPSFRELFDLRRDPFQVRNQLRSAADGMSRDQLPARTRRFARALARDLGCSGRACP